MRHARLGRALATAALTAFATTPARAADPPPSIVLIVIDTLRADAVTALGAPPDVTPNMDRLAQQGLLYTNAWAPAPWTLPSHASLFTGTGFAAHRVGMPGTSLLDESFDTLAEHLKAAGYDTASISENLILVDEFQILQGFDYKVSTGLRARGNVEEIDAPSEVLRWLGRRKSERPYFLFVNLMDPHQPYTIREKNPFVPKEIPESAIRIRTDKPNRLICGGLPSPEQLAVLRGLYLGDVRAADAKVDAILRMLRQQGGASRLISVITSDHGEHLGEKRLLGHEFTMHSAVLKVPLIVNGVPEAKPGRVATTVSLVDIAPSLLKWVGLTPSRAMHGVPLPLAPTDTVGDRVLYAGFSDAPYEIPKAWQSAATPFARDETRQFCTPKDLVWGGMAAAIQPPLTLHWFERYPTQLFDLSWDTAEKTDASRQHPEQLKALRTGLESQLKASGLTGKPAQKGQPLSDEARRALEALGYVER